ncbi:MAG: terpene cyclase/mutase family protein [Chloroflexia bacterium]|nr:terpene cyclase/mutase family protein [Chloroflexia bacterium]
MPRAPRAELTSIADLSTSRLGTGFWNSVASPWGKAGDAGVAPTADPPRAPLIFIVSLIVALHVGPFIPAPALAQEATPEAVSESTAMSPIEAASRWLRAQQDPGGGFPGFDGVLDPGVTTDAAMALFAAQESDPAAAASLAAAIAYLEQNGAPYAQTGPGQAAKLALAAVTGGRDPRDFGGLDLVAAMTAPLATPVPDGVAGIYGDDLYDHALVLIALVAAGETIPETAIDPLRASQGPDGGWAFDGSTAPGSADSNTTALVVQALAASGHGDDPMVERGLAFLASLSAPDGSGFAYGPSDPLVADANSTALVAQALIAAGENPAAREWGNAPLALARFQTPDGGLRYLVSDEEPNLLATLQAIPAMAGLPLPVATGCAAGDDTLPAGCLPLARAA